MRGMVVMLAASGCYHPSVATGVPCGDNNACPAGQQCIAGFCGGSGSGSDVDGDLADMAPPIDAPALCTTWSARHFDPCMLPAPIGDLHLTQALSGFSWDLDTGVLKGKMNTTMPVTTTVMTQTIGPEVLVASVDDFILDANANLDLNGSRALLIAAWGSITISGSVNADASGNGAGPGGSGAYLPANGCGGAPTGDFGTAGTPSTGGGGGAFQGGGGAGGDSGGGGGIGITPPTTLQGGCAGAGGAATGTAATRGAGGGAIQLTARQAIAIMTGANIHAAGGGGGGGNFAYGAGGGGGAGGYIGLDAPTITIAGTLAANGGSGGGGASDVANGSAGVTGHNDANPALGGLGATTTNVGACGRGGSGSSGGTLGGAVGGTSSCGGAGGGGGAGFILVWSPAVDATGATLSPPVMGGP